MMKSSVVFLAVADKDTRVDKLDLKTLMARALKIEERMKKGVNIEDEQRRYHILCERIEYLGRRVVTQMAVNPGEGYLELLIRLQNKFPEETRTARVTANFCPAERVEIQIAEFAEIAKKAGFTEMAEVQTKIKFYREAAKKHLHVLEVPEFVAGENDEDELTTGDLQNKFLAIPVRDQITSGKDSNAFVGLRNQILAVLSDLDKGIPGAINFSDLAHNVITEILNEFAYKKGKPRYVPVTYSDGSKARPMPIQCLKTKSEESRKALAHYPIIPVGMMSGRHHELDEKVQIYVFRNQEISIGRTTAESDEAAYIRAKEIFASLRKEGIYRIAFYQTGFQPAVVGFYRALIEELIAREKSAPTLEVIPYYYFGENYEPGKRWI